MNYIEKYRLWVSKVTDETVKSQLERMKGHDNLIKDAFYKDLEFGTAGLRGIMGAGSNCLNIYTIAQATQGVATYMKAHGFKKAAITYDSRLNAQLFSRKTAEVLAFNGIECVMTEECMPTPFMSYMIRQLGCDTGINITASHNPSEYNGYKVYDGNGCQLLEEDANEITRYFTAIDAFEVKFKPFEECLKEGIVTYNDKSLEDSYITAVTSQKIFGAKGLSVTYTPLNGAGYRLVPRALKEIGAEKVNVVAEQAYPDGNFPTCSYPNPEKKEALQLALKYAEVNGSDIVIGTDPDSDRLGVAVRHDGQYVLLTGNEVGILLTDYILSDMQKRGVLTDKHIVVKTIVTSAMVDKICAHYGVKVVDVLTGFKFIGNVINKLQQRGCEDLYVFGFEESCGYLKGTYVRDKDAVVASVMFADMCAYFKSEGITAVDRINQLYDKYGTYFNVTYSYRFDGADGARRKQALLDQLRAKAPSEIDGKAVVKVTDYLVDETGTPKADVLRYNMEDGSQLIVRPSGTEPLIKCYVTLCGTRQSNEKQNESVKKYLDKVFG